MAIAGIAVGFFTTWTSYIGLWGHAILYIIPWLFIVIHIALTTGWTSATDSSVFLIIVDGLLWIVGLLLHVFLIPPIQKWAAADVVFKAYDENCKCEKCVISKYVAPSDIPRALMACTDNCER